MGNLSLWKILNQVQLFAADASRPDILPILFTHVNSRPVYKQVRLLDGCRPVTKALQIKCFVAIPAAYRKDQATMD